MSAPCPLHSITKTKPGSLMPFFASVPFLLGLSTLSEALQEVNEKRIALNGLDPHVSAAWSQCQVAGVAIHVAGSALSLFDLSNISGVTGCRLGHCNETDRFDVAFAEECAQVCRRVAGCEWWVLGSEGDAQRCWLRPAHGEVRRNQSGFVAGPRSCTPPCFPTCVGNNTVMKQKAGGALRMLTRRSAKPRRTAHAGVPSCAQLSTMYVNNIAKAVKAKNARECQEHCQKTKGCKYFSFLPEKDGSSKGGKCKLQGADAIVKYKPGAVAGPPHCAGLNQSHALSLDATPSCATPGFQYEPRDMPGYNHSKEASAAVCQRRCAKSAGCAHFTFDRDGRCHLAGTQASLKESQGSIVGPASCDSTGADSTVFARWRSHLLDWDNRSDVPCQLSNKAYNPLDMPNEERSLEATASACQARCERVQGCAYFTYWLNGGCHITDASGVLEDIPGEDAVAGPVTCAGRHAADLDTSGTGDVIEGGPEIKVEDSEASTPMGNAQDSNSGHAPASGTKASTPMGNVQDSNSGHAPASGTKVLFVDARGPSRLTGDGVRSLGMLMDLQEACNMDVSVLTESPNGTVLRQSWPSEVSDTIMGKLTYMNPSQYNPGVLGKFSRILIGAKMDIFYTDGRAGIVDKVVRDLLDINNLRQRVSIFWDDVPHQRCRFRSEADEICPRVLPMLRKLSKMSHKAYVLTEKDRIALQGFFADHNIALRPTVDLWPMRLANMAKCLPHQRFRPSLLRHRLKPSLEGVRSVDAGQTLITMMGNHHVVNIRMTKIMFYSGAVHKICEAITKQGNNLKLVFGGQLAQEVTPMVAEMNSTSNMGCVDVHEGFIPEDELVDTILSKTRAFLNPFFFDVESGISVKTYEAVMSGTPFVTSEFGMHGLTDQIEGCKGFPMPKDPTSTDGFAEFIINNVVSNRGYRTFSAAFRAQAKACRDQQDEMYTRDRVCQD